MEPMMAGRTIVTFLVLALIAASATCVGDEPKVVPVGSDATTCSAGQEVCAGACVDTTRDHDNCGACGTACKAGELCTGSQCATSCAGASTACGGACVNLAADQANCGACGNACAPGLVCAGGHCAPSCPAGLTPCGGACVDTATDPGHCGDCATKCDQGQACTASKCGIACQPGEIPCATDAGAAYCANPKSDNANCGACGVACAQGQVCSGGACATSCQANETLCTPDGGTPYCANTQTDDANCGGCAILCGAGTACSGGKCSVTCTAGETLCAGDAGAPYCASTLTDNANCGACGSACTGATPLCSSGICSAVYGDMTNKSLWSSFDTTTVSASAKGFVGAAFDGRFLYLSPLSNAFGGGTADGIVARYDTQNAFASTSSWSTFDTTSVNANARGFVGTAFDGRYVYFLSHSSGSTVLPIVARCDTTASFTSSSSWSAFDTTTVDANAKGFEGATFDGRYVYLVPNWNGTDASGLVARYDTQASFTSTGSWATFDTATNLDPKAKYFEGGVFDGRYVYLVPSSNGASYAYGGMVVRYDSQSAFGAAGSWSKFDLPANVNAGAKGFAGGAFDGRYVYFVPSYDGTFDGIVARYDTQASFTSASSWSTFDVATVNAGAKGFATAGFDGRYVYLVPYADANATYDGIVARYDTRAAFTSSSSWSTFDMTTVNADATGYWGAAFDGRYLYFVPYGNIAGPHGTVMRFDAKVPSSMPKLPGWNGSFF